MSEVAIPEPLSGTEIIDAVLFKVREQLMRDCFLSENSAYEHFSGTIQVKLQAVDCGRVAVIETDVEVNLGRELDEESGAVATLESTDVMATAPPNVVRRDTEQSVPVLVEDQSGKGEIKRIHYQRKAKVK